MKIVCLGCKKELFITDNGGWQLITCKHCSARLYVSEDEVVDNTVEGLADAIYQKLGGTRRKRFFITLTLHTLTFLILLGTWEAGDRWCRAHASGSWPTAPGSIDRLELIRREKTTRADVRFSYEVDGKKHHGTQVSLNEAFETGIDADTLNWMYDKGDPVTVYYDPVNPSFGIIRPGARWSDYWLLIFAVFWLLVIAICHWLIWLTDKPDKMIERLQPIRRWAGHLY